MWMWILITVVTGGIVGWLASFVMKTNSQMGILANIAVGVVGATIGHGLGGVLGLGDFGTLTAPRSPVGGLWRVLVTL